MSMTSMSPWCTYLRTSIFGDKSWFKKLVFTILLDGLICILAKRLRRCFPSYARLILWNRTWTMSWRGSTPDYMLDGRQRGRSMLRRPGASSLREVELYSPEDF